MTIREAISEIGMYQRPTAGSAGTLATRLAGVLGPSLVLALRQTSRRRGRLVLSLILMAAGGGMFMSGLNVAAASERQLAGGVAALGYDLELTLGQPLPAERLLEVVRGAPGVVYAEPVGFAEVAPARSGQAPVSRTQKDGFHGTLRLYALAPESRFRPVVESGRWLQPGDADAIVVAPGQGVAVGETVSLSIGGRASAWRVVGVMPASRVPFGGSAGLYVSDAALAPATGAPVGSAPAVRVITAEHDTAARTAALVALERALAAEGVGVATVVDADWLANVLRNHMAIVQGGLQSLGAVLGVVGALALASAISLSVVERTREFGVMQTIGATPARVIWVVVAEALFIGGASWLAAVALALALSSLVGGLVGSGIFGAPLPLVLSPFALPAWLAVALLGSAAAGAVPARAASRLTIRETLAYA
jgi:putative ABC transport system permease protein